MSNTIKIIITGSTGMVGEGVLIRALGNQSISEILVINRKSCGYTDAKLKEIIHPNFMDLNSIKDQLKGYDACFFCAGISSVGISKEAYEKITYHLTLAFAETLAELNPAMTFTYVSGQGTDSSEKGRSHWARIKGKTENELKKLPFKAVFAYRPGFIKPIEGMKNQLSFYKYIGWLYPIGQKVLPNGFNLLEEIGDSMIYVSLHGFEQFILNGKEIRETAKKL